MNEKPIRIATFWDSILAFLPYLFGLALTILFFLSAKGHGATTTTIDVIRVAPPAVNAPRIAKDATTAATAVLPDNGTVIDMAIFYSSAVRTALGGDAQAQAFATNSVSIDNQVLANSQVSTRLRLVYMGLSPFAETGDGLGDLMTAQQNAEIHTIRDQYGADVVRLLSKSTGGSCGISYIMDPMTAGFQSTAYSNVPYGCVSGYSGAHELGHLLGNDHDPADTTGGGAFPFSQGYQGKSQRDVMAYGSTTRVPCFSNGGRFLWAGQPLGNTVSDAARDIELTSVTVANFRQSVSTPIQTPQPTATPSPTPTPKPAPTATPAPGTIIVTFTPSAPLHQGDIVTISWSGATGSTAKVAVDLFRNNTIYGAQLAYVRDTGTTTITFPKATTGTGYQFVTKPDATGKKAFSGGFTVQ